MSGIAALLHWAFGRGTYVKCLEGVVINTKAVLFDRSTWDVRYSDHGGCSKG